MKKLFSVLIFIMLLITQHVWANTYSEFIGCLDYFSSPSMLPSQYYSMMHTFCYPCWYYSKSSINIGINSSTTGYIDGVIPAILAAQGSNVNVVFDKYTTHTLTKIDLYKRERASKDMILIGTDTNGADGWSIPVDGTVVSWFSTFFIALAYFEGHNIETDGDMTLIFITYSSSFMPNPLPAPPLPTPISGTTIAFCNLTPASTSIPTETPDPNSTPNPTLVPTATPDPNITTAPTSPPTGCTCPVNCDSRTVITVPFTYDGAGEKCWEASALGTYINSWNTDIVNVNGTNYTNTMVMSSQIYPVGGKYYIYYKGSFSWSHFETK